MSALPRILCGLMVAAAITAAAQAPTEITREDLAKFRERLTQLEAETKALKKELEELRAGRVVIEARPRDDSIEPQPGWKRREYNGTPYYVVPLAPTAR